MVIEMSATDTVFLQDIVLDEEAFDKAIEDFSALSEQLKQLRTEIEDVLNGLKGGFNTPAGVKFINSCEKNLFEPLDAQKLVLDHISSTLSESKQAYSSVFIEYESLKNAINNVNNNR